MPRPYGAKTSISDIDLLRANNIRLFIKKNNITLNKIRVKLGIRNSSIYYFMQNKTNLVYWLCDIEKFLKEEYNYEIPTTNRNNPNQNIARCS